MTHIPAGERVLAVMARPGQESADLGGVLYAFRRMGASLALPISAPKPRPLAPSSAPPWPRTPARRAQPPTCNTSLICWTAANIRGG
jgi:hypothetical protein